MFNCDVLLNKNIEVVLGGSKFHLVQPKFIDYIKYCSQDFEPKNDSEEESERTFLERNIYLYKFFKIPIVFLDIRLTDILHNLLMNYKPSDNCKKENEVEKEGEFIKDIDAVYVLSKFCKFYNYTHSEVLEMPLNLFFDMYKKIDVLNSEKSLNDIRIASVSSFLKTEEGNEFLEELKEENIKKINEVFIKETIINTKKVMQELKNMFGG